EIERLNKVMDEKKRNLNKQIKKVSQLEGKAKNVYDTRNKLDEFENKLGKTILGKRTMSSKDLNELKKFVTGVQKVGDRKSTRLNSSHDSISYAVFCLKKNSLFKK